MPTRRIKTPRWAAVRRQPTVSQRNGFWDSESTSAAPPERRPPGRPAGSGRYSGGRGSGRAANAHTPDKNAPMGSRPTLTNRFPMHCGFCDSQSTPAAPPERPPPGRVAGSERRTPKQVPSFCFGAPVHSHGTDRSRQGVDQGRPWGQGVPWRKLLTPLAGAISLARLPGTSLVARGANCCERVNPAIALASSDSCQVDNREARQCGQQLVVGNVTRSHSC